MIQARLISLSADGRRAQVVAYVGEGSARRSITCHVRREGKVWLGRNPDEAAVARMELAEAALVEPASRCERLQPLAEISLEEVERALADFRHRVVDDSEVPVAFRNWHRDFAQVVKQLSASDVKERIERDVAEAAAALKIARDNLDEVRVPRKVEFTF